ncbi:MAG: hypothetical protein GXO19_06205 [Epsilonproteobacteria bacterium]|nr:hypothetical protein [Campylobacterota bacterium]NPA57308.1 hypothetical protein [Campylobacterota bacterium]
MRSRIVITDDFQNLKEELLEEVGRERLSLLEREEFRIDDAKEVVREAYIAPKGGRVIALLATTYNIYAQNALLKILEEPPEGVTFLLAAPSPSTFLPTILSRLPVERMGCRRVEVPELGEFNLQELYRLAREYRKASRREVQGLLSALFRKAVEEGCHFGEEELEILSRALRLTALNGNPATIIITAGLTILEAQKRGKCR